MNLYLLRVRNHLLKPAGADAVGYSEWTMPRGYVVLAKSQEEARAVAASDPENAGATERGTWWEDQNSSTCELVAIDDKPRIVMANEPTG